MSARDENPNPLAHTWFAEAGRGSLAAQRQLRDVLLDYANGTDPQDCVGAVQAYGMAEVLGRMATGHGEPEDFSTLAGILFIRVGRFPYSDALALNTLGEALALAEVAADAGCERASTGIAASADVGLPAQAFAIAKELLANPLMPKPTPKEQHHG